MDSGVYQFALYTKEGRKLTICQFDKKLNYLLWLPLLVICNYDKDSIQNKECLHLKVIWRLFEDSCHENMGDKGVEKQLLQI